MNILSIDTSTPLCSVALYHAIEQRFFNLDQYARKQQGRIILPAINQLLEESKLSLSDINIIAYGNGPGSFTGVRIASSVTQGLAYAINCKVIAISSLAGLAECARQYYPDKPILVLQDACMQQVYCGLYQSTARELIWLSEEKLTAPGTLNLPLSQPFIGIGDAFKPYAEKLCHLHIDFIHLDPLSIASGILALAMKKLAQKQWTETAKALPNYLK